MIEEILESLNLDKEQAKIYFHLLEFGPSTAGQLAKKMAIARTTLYHNLQQMTDKGVIIRTLKYGVRNFAAEHPQKIYQLFQKKIDYLSSQQKRFHNLMPELEKKISGHLFKPTLQIFEGEKGIENALKDTILYRDIETLSFWPVKSMLEIATPQFFNFLNKERVAANNSIRAIWPENYREVDLKKNQFFGATKELKRKVRIAPSGLEFSMGYMIYSNKVLFISSRHEMFAFIVESADLAAVQRAQFEFIWNSSSELKI